MITLAAVAVVTLAALGVAAVFSDDGSSPSRLSVPSSFDGYSHVTGSVARRVESAMRSMAGADSATARMFDAATIGSYAKDSGDQPRLIVLVLRTSEVPAEVGHSPEEITQGLLTVAGNNVADYPAGAHGGSSACADTQFGAVAETMCAWSDSATTGLMVSVATPMTPGGLSAIEQDFRDLVD